jgi:DNA-binding NarL/FixJ family response regulator
MRVLLATDSSVFGDGVASLLEDTDAVIVVGRARSLGEMMDLTGSLAPDAVLVSLRGAATPLAEIQDARRLRREHPALGVVVVAGKGNPFALELLRGGSAHVAYLVDERVPGIDRVLAGLDRVRSRRQVPDADGALGFQRDPTVDLAGQLTRREYDVLSQLAQGKSNRAIASAVYLSVKAVEKYVTTIFRKLGLTDSAQIDRRVSAAVMYLRARRRPGRSGNGQR